MNQKLKINKLNLRRKLYINTYYTYYMLAMGYPDFRIWLNGGNFAYKGIFEI